MHRLIQPEFAPPPEINSVVDEALVIHQRTEPTTNRGLVIFVHGLGGSRYGEHSTWGSFPSFLYDDLPSLDISLYEYRTLFKNLSFLNSVSLGKEAEVFAGIIRDRLEEYSQIVLIGHSMGGLLCKAAICKLLETQEDGALARVAGLILMATPQLGSLSVKRAFGFLFEDFKTLSPHGELVTSINQKFDNEIALDERVITYRKVTIPSWAVEGVRDRWVDPLSAGIGLASMRRKVARGSHTSIVKPPNKSGDAYVWVKDKIEVCLNRFKYDVFVAAAMAGNKDEQGYVETRADVLALIDSLKRDCGFSSVFFAGEDIESKDDFDPKTLALEGDLECLRQSKYFILYYPERVTTSALYEAGMALILGKPAIYLVRDDKDLPFLLGNANQAFSIPLVRIEEVADRGQMIEFVRASGPKLFRFGKLHG